MAVPVIRPMLPADVGAATEMILGNDWGVRREWLQFATSNAASLPLLAEVDGAIVGTGVGTASRPVGWIGTIFIAPEHRGHGLGREITQQIIDRLGDAGCTSLVLVATSEGRRLYERMGFEVQTRYRILEAPGLADATRAEAAPKAWAVRPFEAADLASILELDGLGTGEDRRHALERFASSETARVAVGADGRIGAFVVRAPWGGGATMATTIDAALAIVQARRQAAGPAGRTRVGIIDGNEAGLAALEGIGFRPSWSAPRMVRGGPIDWRPDWIYGQLNHAMG